MNRKHFGIFVLAFLLVGMIAFVNEVQKIQAADSPPLTINANGSITPSTTLITTTDNITYTFTENITGTTGAYNIIYVQRDNIILDGAGHSLEGGPNRRNGLDLGYRNNVTVRNLNIINCSDGIDLNADTWLTIDNCTFEGNYRAIFNGYTDGPKNFTFTNNKVIAPGRARDGVNFGSVNDALIAGNVFQHCGYGLVVYGYENVTIKDNLIDDCSWGIWPLSAGYPNIRVFNNTFTNNGCGICVTGGNHTGLKVYHNYFISNNEHARGEGAILQWDDGYPSGGNYWGGFVSPDLYSGEFQNITGGDGIGDNPFIIPLPYNVKDRYPLMLLGFSNVSQTPPTSNVLPTDPVEVNATVRHVYPLSQVILNCTYTNSTATWTDIINMTNLKDDIWQGNISSFPVGTNVTYAIIAYDNIGNSVSSEDQGYTFEYPVIPEFPSFLILPLFMIASLLAVIVCKRKRSDLFKGIEKEGF